MRGSGKLITVIIELGDKAIFHLVLKVEIAHYQVIARSMNDHKVQIKLLATSQSPDQDLIDKFLDCRGAKEITHSSRFYNELRNDELLWRLPMT